MYQVLLKDPLSLKLQRERATILNTRVWKFAQSKNGSQQIAVSALSSWKSECRSLHFKMFPQYYKFGFSMLPLWYARTFRNSAAHIATHTASHMLQRAEDVWRYDVTHFKALQRSKRDKRGRKSWCSIDAYIAQKDMELSPHYFVQCFTSGLDIFLVTPSLWFYLDVALLLLRSLYYRHNVWELRLDQLWPDSPQLGFIDCYWRNLDSQYVILQ